VLTAGYLLWTLERVFFGPERPEWTRLPDMTLREGLAVGIFVAIIVGLGLFPSILADLVAPAVAPLASRLVALS
jgi:NADH-quinone oxidoreductase subunit M